METQTLTLTEFLLARLDDERRQAARALSDVTNWPRMCDWVAQRSTADVGLFVFDHNPARVLAEVAAKRRIVELHQSCDDVSYGDDSTCPELQALASVYVDHPDYRQEWTA